MRVTPQNIEAFTRFAEEGRVVVFDTETTGNVTVRNRDTMQQDVVAIADLAKYIEDRLEF